MERDFLRCQFIETIWSLMSKQKSYSLTDKQHERILRIVNSKLKPLKFKYVLPFKASLCSRLHQTALPKIEPDSQLKKRISISNYFAATAQQHSHPEQDKENNGINVEYMDDFDPDHVLDNAELIDFERKKRLKIFKDQISCRKKNLADRFQLKQKQSRLVKKRKNSTQLQSLISTADMPAKGESLVFTQKTSELDSQKKNNSDNIQQIDCKKKQGDLSGQRDCGVSQENRSCLQRDCGVSQENRQGLQRYIRFFRDRTRNSERWGEQLQRTHKHIKMSSQCIDEISKGAFEVCVDSKGHSSFVVADQVYTMGKLKEEESSQVDFSISNARMRIKSNHKKIVTLGRSLKFKQTIQETPQS